MGTEPVVIRLSDLVDGQEAVCFAALVKKTRGMTKSNQPYMRCVFRDKPGDGGGPALVGQPLPQGRGVVDGGVAYRLQVRGKYDIRYGMQVEILGDPPGDRRRCRATVSTSPTCSRAARYPADELFKKIHDLIERCIDSRRCGGWWRRSSTSISRCSRRCRPPRAFHHSYTGGLLEHVWSMTPGRQLPGRPLRQVLRPVESSAEPGRRDRGHDPARHRQAPRAGVSPGRGEVHQGRLPDRPHPDGPGHGPRGRGAGSRGSPRRRCSCWSTRSWPITAGASSARRSCPQTMEALLVSFIDELDAKMNIGGPRADRRRRRPTASPTGSSRSTTADSTRASRTERRPTRRSPPST